MEKTLSSIPYPDPKGIYTLINIILAVLIKQAIAPLQILLKLPEYLYIQDTDKLKVALWDSVAK